MCRENSIQISGKTIPIYIGDTSKVESLQNLIDKLVVSATLLDYEIDIENKHKYSIIYFLKGENILSIYFQHLYNMIYGEERTTMYCLHKNQIVKINQMQDLL
ncbi:gp282 [Bacillus phage G]|uniref:Gp282 n=1 Tax=Bacillus phage G TaxID=2884420 RepID=G3MA23_9CAUD|nr:gp282 [Bacillus phage G]AEO93541.1 gp282 [Bacillus phage G]